MNIKELVESWFAIWENGDFEKLPLSDQFKHTSPYGTILGREAYMELIRANKSKFLGHRFEFRDTLFEGNRACIRYTTSKASFTMEVSEWHYAKDGLIEEIMSYYNIEGVIPANRKLASP